MRLIFLTSFIIQILVNSLTGQVAHDDMPIEFDKQGQLFLTIVQVENKPDLIISHGLLLDKIHDFYLDDTYCIVIHDMENTYVVTAAYFDALNQEWVIDYSLKTFVKINDRGVITSELHSMKIIDGNHIETVVTKSGPKSILQRLYGTAEFPIVHTLKLTKSKITYLEFPGTAGYCSDIRPGSPRPEDDK